MRCLNALARGFVLAAVCGATAVHAGLFPTYPIGSGAGVWEVDRYAPAGFTNAGTVNGRVNTLAAALSSADSQANRPPAFSSVFYNTQGRGIQLDLPGYAVQYGSVYLPSAWATTNPGNALLNRRADMWGVISPATGGDICAASACNLFPILGFSNASPTDPLNAGGTGRYRVFDTNIGQVDLATPVTYDQWNDVCTVFTGTELRFFINGAQVYVQTSLAQGDTSFGPVTKMARSIVQTYNFGADYVANWSNLGAGTATGGSVAAGDNQTTALNTAFPLAIEILATDGGGAPLPCVMVTFAVPGSGASAILSTTTAITNAQGIAQVTATANGTPGAYVLNATLVNGTVVPVNLQNGSPAPASIAALSGSPQSTVITTAFAAPLQAQVRDAGGQVLAGATVTFTLPPSGSSGTFPGPVLTANAVTNASGVATSPAVTANANPGPFNAVAGVTGVAATASFALTNTATAMTLAKTMVPASIAPGGTSVLTLALGNPNPVAVSLVSPFTDAMPAGVTTTSANTGTCTGVMVTPSSITLPAGATLAPGGCTIIVAITSTTPGSVVNTTSTLETTIGSTPAASAALTITAPAGGTSLAKSIEPATIVAGANATLTLALGNTGATPITLTAAFVDTMPPGVTTVGGNTGTCTGVTVTASTVTKAGGTTIPAGGCTIVATITSVTPGTVINTTGTLQTSVGNAEAASAPLTITAAAGGPSLAKAFAPANIAAGGSATLTLTLANPSAAPITLTAPFTDTMPAGVAISGTSTGSCSGVTVTPSQLTMAPGATIPPGNCTIVVVVSSSTPGVALNTTSALVTNTGTAPAASASLTVLSLGLAATGGSGQSTPIGTSFAQTLQATVTSGGAGVPGISVTFTLPAATSNGSVGVDALSASGTFPGGATSAIAVTNASGIAVSPVVTANGVPGSYAATATGAGATAAFALTNLALPPPLPATVEPIPVMGLPGLLLLILGMLVAGVRARRRM